MKSYKNYISDYNSKQDEYNTLFLELAHLNELVIKFDFIRYESMLFYFYNDLNLFRHYKRGQIFSIKYIGIWNIFEDKFNDTYSNIQKNMTILTKNHFNTYIFITDKLDGERDDLMEKRFKNI